MAVEKTKVLIADDHRVVREGLVAILRECQDLEVVGEASDGQEAVEKARKLQPDVILMDVSMPRMNGVEATRAI
jgi:YesN/AraC family two-component response regulator